MAADPPASPRRVTVQRIAALCAHYARILSLAGWRFVCAVVPGLKHGGDDAWATVDPDPRTKTARVSVRDIDATPIPGFDGDPMLEIRVTVAHELFHCVVADALEDGVLTIPAEERIVETAAQAMVRSEGLDVRVMARAVRALPSALRARVVASAGQRARGGQMDGKQVLAAIAGQDEAAALKILEQWAAEQIAAAAGGASVHVEPDGDEAAKIETPSGPSEGDMAIEEARRAKGAVMDQDKARARKAADEAEKAAEEIKAMAEAARPAAKEGLVVGLRARLGSSFTPAAEAEIMAAPSFTEAKALAVFAEKLLGGNGVGTTRARSGVEHEIRQQPSTDAMPTVDALRTEGFTDSWLTGYTSALRSGPDVAKAFLEQGRASTRARKAQNGGQ